MPDLTSNGSTRLAAPRTWIDSSESTTHEETTAADGIIAVGVSSESGQSATVTVTVSDPRGGKFTHTVEPPINGAIPVLVNSTVQVTYAGGNGCHAKVQWHPTGRQNP